MKYDAVIYDLDGTLVDSVQGFMRSYEYALSGFYSPNDVRGIVGSALGKNEFGVIKELLPEDWQEGIKRFNLSEDENLKYTEVFDGVVSLLENLKRAGVRQYIVTGKSQRNALKLIRRHDLTSFFDDIAFGVEHGMTKSRNIRLIVSNHGHMNSNRVAYLGDTYNDSVAAIESGVAPIRCAWGNKVEGINYKIHDSEIVCSTVSQFERVVLDE